MARFQYKMQNILDIKYKLESQAKTSFAAASARLLEEEKKLEYLKQRKEEYEETVRRLRLRELDLLEIHTCQQSIEYIKTAIQSQIMAVHIAQRNLESARAHLNEVMIERKTHEKLREREFDEFRHELDSEENKAIDELVSYTYRKKMVNERR